MKKEEFDRIMTITDRPFAAGEVTVRFYQGDIYFTRVRSTGYFRCEASEAESLVAVLEHYVRWTRNEEDQPLPEA